MKSLFSKSLSKKKLIIIFASFIVFAAAFGFMLYESTKKTVAITLDDGREKVIDTHADTIEDVFADLAITLHPKDYVSPAVNTQVKDDLKIVWKRAKQVEIVKDDEKKTVWTTTKTVGELLKDQGIQITKHDKVHPKLENKIKNNLEVKVDKAFPLTLSDGGAEKKVWSTSTTVADFLSQQDISLNDLDRVEPNGKEMIKKNDTIKVIRVEKVTDVVEEPIQFAVVTKKDSNMNKGSEKVVKQGQEGLLTKEFEVVLENGKEVSRKLIKEKKVKEKRDKIVAVGTKIEVSKAVAVSQNNTASGKELNVSRGNSTTTGGKEMYVTSTAYTASCNGCTGKTATGYDLRSNPGAKVIAVDPRVIPLGTKVYVEGYGYAVAADTGGAIKGNKIDVFVPTKSQAYRWGRKTVKIRILN